MSGFSRTGGRWVGVAAARIRSSGAGRALRCRGGPRDARTLTSPFVLARCPRGFSRGQASPVGRLRTASRRSNANPTPGPAFSVLKRLPSLF